PLVYVAGASALAGLLGAVLLTGAVWLLLERRWLLAAGVLFGLAYLSRYHLIALTPFLIVYAGRAKEVRWRNAGLSVGGFLIAVAPCCYRNVILTRNPLYSVISNEILHFTRTYPQQIFYGMTDVPSPIGFALAHPGEMAEKILRFLMEG